MDRASYFPQSHSLKTQYLIIYNLLSAILWLAVFGRVVLLLPLVGPRHMYGGVGEFAKWTQTVAILELSHSVFGTDRPLSTHHNCSKTTVYDLDDTTSLTSRPVEHRHRPLPHFHNLDANLLAHSLGLGRGKCLSRSHFTFTLLQQHAPRLVDHGSDPLQLFHATPSGGCPSRIIVAEI